MITMLTKKINSIAPKITAAGANSIVDNVSKTFIKSASGSILAIFNELGITLQNELPTIQKNEEYGVFHSRVNCLSLNKISKPFKHMSNRQKISLKKVNEGLDSIEGITSQKDKLVSDVSSYVDSTRQAFEGINPS
ncbi:hypothetical protein RCO48_28665 [Peribacillus frigoritolerans]|nr:hypothetical protein [Peribacillus frigoritolerans]